ncbi:hypothetical protein BDK51DRAFT_30250, partial [Blyttiomyces helicus]
MSDLPAKRKKKKSGSRSSQEPPKTLVPRKRDDAHLPSRDDVQPAGSKRRSPNLRKPSTTDSSSATPHLQTEPPRTVKRSASKPPTPRSATATFATPLSSTAKPQSSSSAAVRLALGFSSTEELGSSVGKKVSQSLSFLGRSRSAGDTPSLETPPQPSGSRLKTPGAVAHMLRQNAAGLGASESLSAEGARRSARTHPPPPAACSPLPIEGGPMSGLFLPPEPLAHIPSKGRPESPPLPRHEIVDSPILGPSLNDYASANAYPPPLDSRPRNVAVDSPATSFFSGAAGVRRQTSGDDRVYLEKPAELRGRLLAAASRSGEDARGIQVQEEDWFGPDAANMEDDDIEPPTPILYDAVNPLSTRPRFSGPPFFPSGTEFLPNQSLQKKGATSERANRKRTKLFIPLHTEGGAHPDPSDLGSVVPEGGTDEDVEVKTPRIAMPLSRASTTKSTGAISKKKRAAPSKRRQTSTPLALRARSRSRSRSVTPILDARPVNSAAWHGSSGVEDPMEDSWDTVAADDPELLRMSSLEEFDPIESTPRLGVDGFQNSKDLPTERRGKDVGGNAGACEGNSQAKTGSEACRDEPTLRARHGRKRTQSYEEPKTPKLEPVRLVIPDDAPPGEFRIPPAVKFLADSAAYVGVGLPFDGFAFEEAGDGATETRIVNDSFSPNPLPRTPAALHPHDPTGGLPPNPNSPNAQSPPAPSDLPPPSSTVRHPVSFSLERALLSGSLIDDDIFPILHVWGADPVPEPVASSVDVADRPSRASIPAADLQFPGEDREDALVEDDAECEYWSQELIFGDGIVDDERRRREASQWVRGVMGSQAAGSPGDADDADEAESAASDDSDATYASTQAQEAWRAELMRRGNARSRAAEGARVEAFSPPVILPPEGRDEQVGLAGSELPPLCPALVLRTGLHTSASAPLIRQNSEILRKSESPTCRGPLLSPDRLGPPITPRKSSPNFEENRNDEDAARGTTANDRSDRVADDLRSLTNASDVLDKVHDFAGSGNSLSEDLGRVVSNAESVASAHSERDVVHRGCAWDVLDEDEVEPRRADDSPGGNDDMGEIPSSPILIPESPIRSGDGGLGWPSSRPLGSPRVEPTSGAANVEKTENQAGGCGPAMTSRPVIGEARSPTRQLMTSPVGGNLALANAARIHACEVDLDRPFLSRTDPVDRTHPAPPARDSPSDAPANQARIEAPDVCAAVSAGGIAADDSDEEYGNCGGFSTQHMRDMPLDEYCNALRDVVVNPGLRAREGLEGGRKSLREILAALTDIFDSTICIGGSNMSSFCDTPARTAAPMPQLKLNPNRSEFFDDDGFGYGEIPALTVSTLKEEAVESPRAAPITSRSLSPGPSTLAPAPSSDPPAITTSFLQAEPGIFVARTGARIAVPAAALLSGRAIVEGLQDGRNRGARNLFGGKSLADLARECVGGTLSRGPAAAGGPRKSAFKTSFARSPYPTGSSMHPPIDPAIPSTLTREILPYRDADAGARNSAVGSGFILGIGHLFPAVTRTAPRRSAAIVGEAAVEKAAPRGGLALGNGLPIPPASEAARIRASAFNKKSLFDAGKRGPRNKYLSGAGPRTTPPSKCEPCPAAIVGGQTETKVGDVPELGAGHRVSYVGFQTGSGRAMAPISEAALRRAAATLADPRTSADRGPLNAPPGYFPSAAQNSEAATDRVGVPVNDARRAGNAGQNPRRLAIQSGENRSLVQISAGAHRSTATLHDEPVDNSEKIPSSGGGLFTTGGGRPMAPISEAALRRATLFVDEAAGDVAVPSLPRGGFTTGGGRPMDPVSETALRQAALLVVDSGPEAANPNPNPGRFLTGGGRPIAPVSKAALCRAELLVDDSSREDSGPNPHMGRFATGGGRLLAPISDAALRRAALLVDDSGLNAAQPKLLPGGFTSGREARQPNPVGDGFIPGGGQPMAQVSKAVGRRNNVDTAASRPRAPARASQTPQHPLRTPLRPVPNAAPSADVVASEFK